MQGDALGSTGRVGDEVQGEGVLNQFEPRVTSHGLHECSRYLSAGGIASRVRDAVAMMPALATEGDLAVGRGVKAGAEAHEAAHGRGTFRHQDSHSVFIAQAHARDQGVFQMLIWRVILSKGRSDTALSPLRGSFIHRRLGDEQHRPTSPPRMQGGGEPSNTRADDDHIGMNCPTGMRGSELD